MLVRSVFSEWISFVLKPSFKTDLTAFSISSAALYSPNEYLSIIAAERIVAIVSPESAPIKRLVQEAKDNKNAIDATCGRRTRAVLIMDSGHIILSAVQPETVGDRIDKTVDDNN